MPYWVSFLPVSMSTKKSHRLRCVELPFTDSCFNDVAPGVDVVIHKAVVGESFHLI